MSGGRSPLLADLTQGRIMPFWVERSQGFFVTLAGDPTAISP